MVEKQAIENCITFRVVCASINRNETLYARAFRETGIIKERP